MELNKGPPKEKTQSAKGPHKRRTTLTKKGGREKKEWAEKLLELVQRRRKEDIESVVNLLDRLWRKVMKEKMTEKDSEAIEAAKKFLREVNSNSS